MNQLQNNKSKRIKYYLIGGIVLLILGFFCLGIVFGGRYVGNLIKPSETPQTEDISEVIVNIEAQVVELRGLALTESVNRSFISMAELEEIVTEDFFSDYSDQQAFEDVLTLSLLGFIPDDFELKDFYQALFSEQIAGFYDDESKELFVVQGVSFGGSEKMTYAHEFTHLLQDQNFGFQDGLDYTEEACEADSERCAAVQALIEGDATLTEILWFQTYATRADYDDLMDAFESFESPVLDSAPPSIAADLYFPYEKGMVFVEYLYDRGGFEAVNDAYRNPPLSTEQILHPERYPNDVPQAVSLPNLAETLGDGWVLMDENTMGEWSIYLILSQGYVETYRLEEDVAQTAAEGWGGDAYVFYRNETSDALVFVLDAVWDTIEDAQTFSEALMDYASLRWEKSGTFLMDFPVWEGSEGVSTIYRQDERTIWVVSPSAEMTESILMELQ